MFSCESYETFKNTYFEEHLGTAASVTNDFYVRNSEKDQESENSMIILRNYVL